MRIQTRTITADCPDNQTVQFTIDEEHILIDFYLESTDNAYPDQNVPLNQAASVNHVSGGRGVTLPEYFLFNNPSRPVNDMDFSFTPPGLRVLNFPFSLSEITVPGQKLTIYVFYLVR